MARKMRTLERCLVSEQQRVAFKEMKQVLEAYMDDTLHAQEELQLPESPTPLQLPQTRTTVEPSNAAAADQ